MSAGNVEDEETPSLENTSQKYTAQKIWSNSSLLTSSPPCWILLPHTSKSCVILVAMGTKKIQHCLV